MPHMRSLLAAFAVIAFTKGAFAAPTVEALRESETQATCGCNFQFSTSQNRGKTFLQWSEGEDALMRVDGTLQKLAVSPAQSKVKKAGVIAIGDESNYALSNSAYQVNVYGAVAQVCPEKNAECESIGYRARISVRSPQGTTSVKATGACGC